MVIGWIYRGIIVVLGIFEGKYIVLIWGFLVLGLDYILDVIRFGIIVGYRKGFLNGFRDFNGSFVFYLG